MITLFQKVRFSHPDFVYSGTSYTEYLFGSIGLKVNAEIKFDVKWSVEDVNMRYTGVGAGDVSAVEILDGVTSFLESGFKVGDTVVIEDTANHDGTYTVTALTDELMTFASGTFLELADERKISSIFGETPITAIDFYPNLIENANEGSLFNLTDRETEPRYSADSVSASSMSLTTMIVTTNSKGWVTPADNATIDNVSFTSHIQRFVINHSFTITPLFLANQLSNLQNMFPPAGDFLDRLCLKYFYKIDAKFTRYDPDVPHTTDGNIEFPKGNTGWFNEFINGRPTTYTKKSIAYTDALTSAALSSIDYCKEVDIEAKINASGIGPGPNGIIDTGPDGILAGDDVLLVRKFILHILYLPLNEERYINTKTDYKSNFIYERAVVTSGAAAVQGENTGDEHFLKDVTATVTNVNEVKINFTTEFSDTLIDFFDCLDDTNRNFLIFVTVQEPDVAVITNIDQTAVILDVNEYVCNKDDSTLFQIIDEVQFFEYPHCAGVGYSDFSLLPMDTVVLKAQFHVKQGTELNPILLSNISANIIAVRQNQVEEFPLESFTINTSEFLPNCDNVQEIEFNQARDFILPDTDCRNLIQLLRMPTLDVAGYSAYELIYPFKVRWEEWRAMQGASRCFPTPTQNWRIYSNESGWSIKFSIKAEVEQQFPATDCLAINPVITDFEHIVWGTIKDPCDIPYSVEFNTFDSTGANTYEEIIAKDADTKIEATITGDFSGYTVEQLYGILTLDAWGIGGVAYSQEIGTRIDINDDSVWKGAGSSLRATLTKVNASTLTLTAYIDYLYLPSDTEQFILSARIGEFVESASSSGADCTNEITITNFTCGELQIIEVMSADVLIVSGSVRTAELRDVFVEEMILTFVTATTWVVTAGGKIDGQFIMSGTVAGNIIKAPAHPYTDANVGDTLQGDITGTLNTSLIEINGIGDMQIGCTFFVS